MTLVIAIMIQTIKADRTRVLGIVVSISSLAQLLAAHLTAFQASNHR